MINHMSQKMIKGIRFIFLFLLLSVPAYAQTASILPLGRTQYFDNNGNPLSGGKVYNYIPGTTTFKTTWQDSAEAIANTNPVILDAAGRALIYGEGTYRQIVRKADNSLVWDAVTSATGSGGGSAGTGDGDLVGTVKPWAGITAPNQYAFAFGQELSRVTFAPLLTAITLTANVVCTSASNTLTGIADTTTINVGADIEVLCMPAGTLVVSKTASTVVASNPATLTINASAVFFPFGNGDGSTTFNVPDLRGYVIAGRDNMGGLVAGRLTTTYFGTNTPDAQGATGGSQNNSITIVQANLPAVTLTTSIASGQGSHTHTYHSTLGNLDNTGASGYTSSVGSGSISDAATLPAMTGTTPLGGVATPILSSVVQPTITLSYIIKITPDVNSSVATGVTSLGSMTGSIACGSGLLCTGNTISAIPNAGAISGPGSSTDNAIVRWDGTTGNNVQNSAITIDDNGNTNTGVSANATISTSIINSNAGTSALSVFSLSNGTSIGGLVMGGTGYTAIAGFQNSLIVSVPSAADSFGIYQTGNKPTVVYRSGVEIARFPVSGGNILNLGTNASGIGGALGLYGSSTGLANVICPAVCGTPTISLPILTANLATLALTETFTNKTLTSPAINTPTITGGTHISATALSIRNTAAAFDLLFASVDATMAANRTLTWNTNNGSRTINIAGDIALSGALTTSGSSSLLTQTYTGAPTIAFGAGGTVAYTANNLSVFATTTSAQFFGVISDETGGAGVVVGSSSPTITTPTFTTSATFPLHIGGTAAGSSAIIQSTSNGAASGDFIDILVGNNGAQRAARFLNGPFFLIGGTANVSGYRQQIDITSGGLGFSASQWSNDVVPIFTTFQKSRGVTVGAHTIVQSGDNVGFFSFSASDGVGMINTAAFGALIDGTPGVNDMPGRLTFQTTADGSATLTERMRIDNTGGIFMYTIAASAQANALCYNSGTKLVTFNSGVTTCLASMASVKNLHSPISPNEALETVMAMQPWTYLDKNEHKERIGLVAEYVAKVDERLVARDDHGELSGVRYEQYTAHLTGAIQALKAANDNLRFEIEQLKANRK